MSDEYPDSHASLVWLDQLCDRFEEAFGTENQFSVESALSEVPADRRAAVLKALLPLEIELRTKAGQSAETEEWLRRFPDDTSVIDSITKQFESDSPASHETIAPVSPPLHGAGRRERAYWQSAPAS